MSKKQKISEARDYLASFVPDMNEIQLDEFIEWEKSETCEYLNDAYDYLRDFENSSKRNFPKRYLNHLRSLEGKYYQRKTDRLSELLS